MLKQPGGGPPWPKDSAEKDELPQGEHEAELEPEEVHVEESLDTVEQAAEPQEISIEEVIEGFGKPQDSGESDEVSTSGKSTRTKRRQERGRGAPTEVGEADSFMETPRENRDALRDAVAQFEDVSSQSSAEAERSAVQAAESAYLTAYKQLEQKRTIWNRLSKGKDLEEEADKVDALKRVYDEKRVSYAEALTRSAKERLEAKGASALRTDAVVERYNRIVRFNEVVKPAAEKRIAARREALDARGKGTFEKTLGWSARQNQRLEKHLGKTGATALRAIIGAVGVSGIMAAAGGFGAAALTGAGVYGVHKFARGFIGAYAGKLGGDMAGAFYEQRLGKIAQQNAKESLKTQGRREELSVEMLESIDRLREKLASRADDATVQKKKALVQALVAFGIGAGTAAALSEVFAVQNAADTVAGAVVESSDTSAPEAPSTPSGIEGNATPVPEVAGAETVLAEAVVGRGEGFNQLFLDLRASGLSPDSPVAQHLLNPELSPSELSREVGALLGEKSAVTQVGDKLFVNGDGSLVFERDGVQQVLMENKAGAVSVQTLSGVELKGTASSIPESVEVSGESEPATIAVAPETESPQPEVTIGRSLAEFGADAEAGEVVQPQVTETIGRPLEQFAAQDQASVVSSAPEQHSGTVGRSLEDFDTHPAEETFTNMHGVEVNPTEPAAYVWKVPGTDTSITVASGGTPEAQSAFAHAYADAHPGSTVHFVTSVFEDGVAKYRMDVWDSVEGTPAQRYTDVVSGQSGTPYPSLSADNFTRKLP